jgi:hypothetical protein
VCSNVPAGLSRSPLPAARALRIDFNFSPQKAGTAAGGLPHVRRRKGATYVDRAVLRVVATAATLPLILLLAATLGSYKVLVEVEINCPLLLKFISCPNPLVCDELCSFVVWNADGVCCSGLDVQTAPRRLVEFLKWGQWFSKSGRGGYQKPW